MPEGNDKLGGMLSISLGLLSFCRVAQQLTIVLVRRHDYLHREHALSGS